MISALVQSTFLLSVSDTYLFVPGAELLNRHDGFSCTIVCLLFLFSLTHSRSSNSLNQCLKSTLFKYVLLSFVSLWVCLTSLCLTAPLPWAVLVSLFLCSTLRSSSSISTLCRGVLHITGLIACCLILEKRLVSSALRCHLSFVLLPTTHHSCLMLLRGMDGRQVTHLIDCEQQA